VLTTVVFDADETLIDLRPAVTGGLVAVLAEMRRLTAAAAEVTLADLESDWDTVFGAMAADPVMAIRRGALARRRVAGVRGVRR
jgi:FMN phosphatase YigB (HAD superfamily)